MRDRCVGAIVCAAVCVGISAKVADASDGFFNEVRLGLYDHDTGVVGSSKESGADFGLEIVSRPLITLSFASPMIVAGVVVNTAGQTNQLYLGLADQWEFAHSAFAPDDAFYLEGTIGADWHDGKIDVRGTPLEPKWKSHGSRVVIRTGVDLGYRIDSTWSVALSFNHISNGDLADANEGMNDLGVRVGMRF
jgi:lipid A 3-O-deacylase